MTRLRWAAAATVVVVALIAPAATARAQLTNTSAITQIKVLQPSHPSYPLLHGAVWLEVDRATHNYRWGGKHCGDVTLSPLTLDLMLAAFRSRYGVTIEYQNRDFKKQRYRCITAITVTRS